jgi:Xaa-Pro aminopeptidase
VGKKPTTEQRRLCDLSLRAMAAGKSHLRPGMPCRDIWNAINNVYASEGMSQFFGHHAGHGIGLTHPEAPFLVPQSSESLMAGDVITLEPGLYVPGVGGLRIEHNYLITESGYERLSQHTIALC